MTALQHVAPNPPCRVPCAPAPPTSASISPEASLIQSLMSQPESNDFGEQMNATARQLGLLSGWRWAAVARLLEGGKVAQLLALTEVGRTVPGFTYDMAISPCAVVARSPGITHIDQIREHYGPDSYLRKLGVLHYAGVACRLGETQIGHVFVMHNEPLTHAQAHQVDALLQLTALHVGHRMQLHGVQNKVRDWQQRAEADTLTQLPNRHAFERELELQRSLVGSGARDDSLLAIFNVDGLKTVNDRHGHLTGDEVLRMTSTLLRGHLRRNHDAVFRIGGDKFAVLTDAPRDSCEAWLRERTATLVKKLRSTYPEVGISVGLARLMETRGQRTQWLELADKRVCEKELDCQPHTDSSIATLAQSLPNNGSIRAGSSSSNESRVSGSSGTSV
jgi:diguanylate cyclase (GGDEF)-like protein